MVPGFPIAALQFQAGVGQSVFVHTGGDTKAMTCSGSAWYLEARVVHNSTEIIFPVAMSGMYFADAISSFIAR